MSVVVPMVKLNDGREIPSIGLGTWTMSVDECREAVKAAIDVGYRHFDTAVLYQTEKGIGEAVRYKIAEGVVTREEIVVTSKLWCTQLHPDHVIKACKKSVKNLGLDYVDLYLIHWPMAFKAMEKSEKPVENHHGDLAVVARIPQYFPRDASGNLIFSDDDYVDTWKELEKCVEMGLAKSIGVSNFNSQQIDRLLKSAKIKPAVIQIEVHPYMNQKKLINFCKEREITVMAYACLGGIERMKSPKVKKMLDNPAILKISHRKKKTPAQIILRYVFQMGTIVLFKTTKSKRLLENISIFDFSLTDDEMRMMDALNCNDRVYIIPGSEKHPNYPFKDEF